MGNYVSCTLATPLIKNAKAARIIFPTGEIRHIREPIKAAELMLECPNHFITNTKSLHIGRRFSPLSADEELEFGNVYVMFPMKRSNAVVSAADMATLFMAANSVAKRLPHAAQKVNVLPEKGSRATEEDERPRLSFEDIEGFPVSEFQHRLSMCRSRKPVLETIAEEHVWSR